jgi:uncharacterized protein
MELKLSNDFERTVKKDDKVIAVLVFGSYARGEHHRDIDICIVLDKKHAQSEMSRIKLKFSSILPTKFDVKIFQQLPIYIRKRILKEGKILSCKNESLLYEIAYQTIKEFAFFEKTYNFYLEGIKNG